MKKSLFCLVMLSLGCIDLIGAGSITPLHEAAEKGNVDWVRLILGVRSLDTNAAVSAGNRLGRTPLHVAAWHGHFEVVMTLLTTPGVQVDALIRAQDHAGFTALHFAASRGHDKIVWCILKIAYELYSNERSPEDRLAYVRFVANTQTRGGWAPLHFASRDGHRQCVIWLLARGANINVVDGGGETPLDWARAMDAEMIALLKANGGRGGKDL